MSVSSIEEKQDFTRHCSSGIEFGGGASRLLSMVPCSSPPPLCPIQGSLTLASPVSKELLCHRVSRPPQEASSSDTVMWSGSSHSCEITNTYRISGHWGSGTRKQVLDNQSCNLETVANVQGTPDKKINILASAENKEVKDISPQSTEVLQTEYIIVDIPLQMGMGSPYSSSCFILIDR